MEPCENSRRVAVLSDLLAQVPEMQELVELRRTAQETLPEEEADDVVRARMHELEFSSRSIIAQFLPEEGHSG